MLLALWYLLGTVISWPLLTWWSYREHRKSYVADPEPAVAAGMGCLFAIVWPLTWIFLLVDTLRALWARVR